MSKKLVVHKVVEISSTPLPTTMLIPHQISTVVPYFFILISYAVSGLLQNKNQVQIIYSLV